MKLTNNLSREQSFNTYPFTLLHEYRSQHDSIYEGYRDGIDASVYANPTMPVAYMKNMKTALMLLKNKDKWNEYTSKTLEVEFVDKD